MKDGKSIVERAALLSITREDVSAVPVEVKLGKLRAGSEGFEMIPREILVVVEADEELSPERDMFVRRLFPEKRRPAWTDLSASAANTLRLGLF